MVRKRISDGQQAVDGSRSRARIPEDRPRLMFVVNDPAFFLSHRLVIARAAQDAGFAVFVATPTGQGVEKIRAQGFTYVPIQLDRWGTNPIKEILSLFYLFRVYRKIRPHIVHHVTIKPVLYGSLIARLTGIPAVVNAISGLGFIFIARGWYAGIRKKCIQAVYRLVLRHRNSKVVFQNPDDRDFFITNALIKSGEYVIINGSGVDTSRFAPSATSNATPVVLMVARLLRDKGLYEFVDAARQLRRSGVKARFVVAGDPAPGNPAAISPAQLAVWAEEGIIELRGHCTEMPSLYKHSDIVCLPSYREGLPKALIEGASAGKPLVATDVPGCREIIRQGVNGFLVSLGDSVGLARALETLIVDTDLRTRMGALSRAIILSEGFGEEYIVERTLRLYSELLAPLGIVPFSAGEASVRESSYLH